MLLGEVHDVLRGVRGPRHVRLAGPEGSAQGVEAPDKLAVPQGLQDRLPIRVMIRMFTTTYSESVSWTPMREKEDPSGPMLNGITYIVRPLMQPLNRPSRIAFISRGSTQLFVGPASCLRDVQTKVRSSTRATSEGSENAA